ncbi:MAG: MFS transporter [Pseudomonadota bacterium]
MAEAVHYETRPEDRIPILQKLVYGLGAFVNNTLAAAIGGMIIVLNLGFGMNPILVGWLGALPRLTDALTDPLMGYISDNTRSRWGRRRPYIFVGAIAAGVIFALLWQLPVGKTESWYFYYFLAGSFVFFLAYTVYATPWVALGYELTPDYHERTRLMGVQNFIGNLAYLVSPYFLAIMYSEYLFDNVADGAAGLGLIIGVIAISVGVLPAIFLRERFKPKTDDEAAAANEDSGSQEDLQPASELEALRAFAGADADYYMSSWGAAEPTSGDTTTASPRFSVNWSAMILSIPWLAYRRMWRTLLVYVLAASACVYAVDAAATSILAGGEQSTLVALAVKIGSVALYLVPPVTLGLIGNRLYLSHALETVRGASAGRALNRGMVAKLAARGGTLARNVPAIENFFTGFATALRFSPFRKLCIATFLVFNGFIMIAAFQSYVIIYYVFGGDKSQGATFAGHSGLLQGLVGLVVIAFVTWLATKIGKRRAFFVSTGISILGYALKWFCYSPDNPWFVLFPAPLMAFALAGLFTLMPSMVADVVDMDELNTNERREGMYGSIFWWVVKLGQSVALIAGGILLNITGFDVELGGNQTEQAITLMRLFDAFIPCAASLIAIWAVASFSITEERAHEVREELEARRGAAKAAPA